MTTLKCKNCNAELKPQDKFCLIAAVVVVETTPQQNTHQRRKFKHIRQHNR